MSVVSSTGCILCFSDNAVTWCQKYRLGVIRWKKETRDLPRRQVSPHAELRQAFSGNAGSERHSLRKGSETQLIGSVVDNKFNSAVCCLHTFLLHNLINLLNKLVASGVSCSRSIFFLYVTHQQIILHLSASYNELPASLSDCTVLKQMPSVAPEGSKVTAHDVTTSFMITNTWTCISSFSHNLCVTQPFSDPPPPPPPSPIPIPVLPSPLPASPFPPSVFATRSTTGSRAWPSVCTGTWGRSRTTSAQRTRSSEAVFMNFEFFSKASGTSQSWLEPDRALCHFILYGIRVVVGLMYQTSFKKPDINHPAIPPSVENNNHAA